MRGTTNFAEIKSTLEYLEKSGEYVGGIELVAEYLEGFGEQIIVKAGGGLLEKRPISGAERHFSKKAALWLGGEFERRFKELEALAEGRIDSDLLRDTFAFRRQIRKAVQDIFYFNKNRHNMTPRYYDAYGVYVTVKDGSGAEHDIGVSTLDKLMLIGSMIYGRDVTNDPVRAFAMSKEDEKHNLRERWLELLETVENAKLGIQLFARPFIGKELGAIHDLTCLE